MTAATGVRAVISSGKMVFADCAATYFPETNVLGPVNSRAEKSNTPTSKQVIIKVRPSGQ